MHLDGVIYFFEWRIVFSTVLYVSVCIPLKYSLVYKFDVFLFYFLCPCTVDILSIWGFFVIWHFVHVGVFTVDVISNRRFVHDSVFYILRFFQYFWTFCPRRCFIHSTFFFTLRRFVPVDDFYRRFFSSTFCPSRRFFHSTFCPIRRFFFRRFVGETSDETTTGSWIAPPAGRRLCQTPVCSGQGARPGCWRLYAPTNTCPFATGLSGQDRMDL